MKKTKHNAYIFFSVLITCFLCGYFSFLMRDYTADDALIYYRYIQNFLDGYGLVYNIGEKFNGLTSPLYTYISISLAFIFHNNIQYTQIGIGAFFLFLTSIMLIPLFKHAVSEKIIILFPPLLASSVYFYKTFGLETTMLLFLILLAICLFNRGSYFMLAITSSLLLLTRGESLFFIITLVFYHFFKKRKNPSIKIFIIPGIILCLHFSFTYIYYGALLPNTLSAKIKQGASGLWGTMAFMHHSPDFFDWFFNKNLFVLTALLATALIGLYAARKNMTMRIMLVFLFLYCTFFVALNIPDYFWYYGYVFLVFYTLSLWGMQGISDFIGRSSLTIFKKYNYVIVLLVFLSIFIQQTTIAYKKLNGLEGHTPYTIMGKWIRDNTEPNAKIACIEIGHIGWYSRRYIIDILGLINPYNADFIGEKKFDAWLNHYSPDYILVWVPLRPHEVSIKRLLDEKLYAPYHDFDFNGWRFRLLRKAG